MSFSSCEDKGDSGKFIGIWKVESLIKDGVEEINDQWFLKGTIKIIDAQVTSNFAGGSKDWIFYTTEETWVGFRGNKWKVTGQIRFEKGSAIMFRFHDNVSINGIYEWNGSILIIKGESDMGKLYKIVLSRYSF